MRFLLLFFILNLTVACSRSEVMVRFFDTVAVSKTDDYFDLSSQQRDELKKDIQSDVEKARKEFFPEVAKSLRKIEHEVQKDKLDAAFVSARFSEFQNYFKKVSSYFTDSSVKLVLTLEPAQFEHFSQEIHKDIKDSNDEEQASRDAHKRYRRSLEFWVGGLSADQKEKLRQFLVQHPYPAKLQNENKEHVLKQFLEARKNPDTLKKFVRDFYQNYESLRLPAFTQALENHKNAFQKFLVEELWPTFTKTQRRTLRDNLLARAEELEKIAQRP